MESCSQIQPFWSRVANLTIPIESKTFQTPITLSFYNLFVDFCLNSPLIFTHSYKINALLGFLFSLIDLLPLLKNGVFNGFVSWVTKKLFKMMASQNCYLPLTEVTVALSMYTNLSVQTASRFMQAMECWALKIYMGGHILCWHKRVPSQIYCQSPTFRRHWCLDLENQKDDSTCSLHI